DLQAGDYLLLSQDVYGASMTLLQKVWSSAGVKTLLADFADTMQIERILAKYHPKAVFFETISNPTLKVADGPRIVELAHAYGAQVLVDNTFGTPVLIQPIAWGVDIVLHSATKYLGGHGDAMGGIVSVSDRKRYMPRLLEYQRLRGAVLGPFEAWLIHRGLRTLWVRMERQCASAWTIAQELAQRPDLFERVHYPLLPSHPSQEVARRLLPSGQGGAVVTVDLRGDFAQANQFLTALQLIVPAVTVGDVYSLSLYPIKTSHRNVPVEVLRQMGISEQTVRLSIGLENAQDLLKDIIEAAEKAVLATPASI
ncbi:MAG: PLP-dependent aspartate aminotransferase family protein, partial [Firmicutes bacterium]|nr:PLP-dependent aspartate aminotransferase family protein [Bacillota bacterium]